MYVFLYEQAGELMIWLSWMDNNLIVGPLQVMNDEGKKLTKEIKVEDVGKLKEFLGCKIKIDKSEQSPKYTQPVMIKSIWCMKKEASGASRTKHSPEETRI